MLGTIETGGASNEEKPTPSYRGGLAPGPQVGTKLQIECRMSLVSDSRLLLSIMVVVRVGLFRPPSETALFVTSLETGNEAASWKTEQTT